jgi:hypothetical protein
MSDTDFVEALISRLENELEADFPGWLISRESSGRWVATRSGWGRLYGRTAAALRERLTRYGKDASDV